MDKIMTMFRKLNSDEEKEFRAWARENYELYAQISTLWHPIVQLECTKMNVEDYNSKCNEN